MPVATSVRPPAPGWTPPPGGESDGRARVLYVDVDDASFEETRHRLRYAYELIRASRDREACEQIRAHHRSLVAVLMDVDMPGSVLDGILLTRLLRGRVPENAVPPFARNLPRLEIPIGLVTAPGESYEEDEMLRYGGDRLIVKPIEIHKVTLTIVEWHLLNSEA